MSDETPEEIIVALKKALSGERAKKEDLLVDRYKKKIRNHETIGQVMELKEQIRLRDLSFLKQKNTFNSKLQKQDSEILLMKSLSDGDHSIEDHKTIEGLKNSLSRTLESHKYVEDLLVKESANLAHATDALEKIGNVSYCCNSVVVACEALIEIEKGKK